MPYYGSTKKLIYFAQVRSVQSLIQRMTRHHVLTLMGFNHNAKSILLRVEATVKIFASNLIWRYATVTRRMITSKCVTVVAKIKRPKSKRFITRRCYYFCRCQPVHIWANELNEIDEELKTILEKPVIMKNNSVCHVGLCQHKFDPNENKNVTRCIVNIGDTPSLSNILEYFQPEKFKDLVKNNITGAIMIFSLMLWVS